jgi:hypothetical protein
MRPVMSFINLLPMAASAQLPHVWPIGVSQSLLDHDTAKG